MLEIERTDIMLKIREDVQFNVLENYGFVDDEIYGRKVKVKKMMTKEKYNAEIVEIDLKTGQLQIFVDDEYYENYTKSDTLDIINKIIKNDVVVKVEE